MNSAAVEKDRNYNSKTWAPLCRPLRHTGPVFHPDRQDPYLRPGTIAVFVQDHNRSLQFYLDQLGFRLAFDALTESGDRWLAVSPIDGTAMLVLATPMLLETLDVNRELPSHALPGSVVQEIRRFGSPEQHDDIALVVARCRPS